MPDRTERTSAPATPRARVLASNFRRYFWPVALLLAGFPVANAEDKVFDIDAGAAAQSLNDFARQADVELGYAIDAVADIRTNAVNGSYEVGYALHLLLDGSGLLATQDSNGFIVRRNQAIRGAEDPSAPVPDTTTRKVDDSRTNTKHGGQRQSEAKEGMTAVKMPPIEEIVVTGSHVRGAGNAGSLPLSFDREDLAKTGFSTVEELFESLPQNLDEITPIGAVATGATNLAGFNTQGATAINLRGLGAGSTLVLLNGKRRPGNINGRAVDVSAIPLSMVERVDVVTGGYSAVYGSDAVAGVVNVITRREFSGAETQVYYGQSSAGGERINFNQTIGFEAERGGFVLGYDYRDDRPLDAADTGALRLPSRAGLAPIPGLFHIQGAAVQHAGLLAGHLQLNSNIELYADAQVALDEYTNQLAYQILGCCDLDIHIVTDSEQYSAVGGARFSAAKLWNIDLSVSHGSVGNTAYSGSIFTSEPGIVDRSDPRPLPTERDEDEAELTSLSAVADGPFSLFDRSVTAAVGMDYRNESYFRTSAPITTGLVDELQERDRDIWSVFGEVHVPLIDRNSQSVTVSLAARYDDYSDFGNTFNPQIGVEWRPGKALALRGSFATAFRAPELFELSQETRVRIATLLDPADPSGQTSATVLIDSGGNEGLQPEKADTYTMALSWQPTDTTELSVSYFDIDFDGRIDTPDSFSGGFAALENESLYPALIDRSPAPSAVDAILSRAALIINNTGIPFDRETDDPFATFENIVIFDNRTNNIALEAVNGLDIGASAGWEAATGRWSIGLNGTYYLDFDRNITSASPAVSQLNKPGRPIDVKLRGHVEWGRGPWTARMLMNYVDSYADTISVPSVSVDSWTTVDLIVRFDAGEVSDVAMLQGFAATLGVNNLLDEPPPVLVSNDLGLGYDAINSNPIGRFLSLRFAKQW